MKETISVVGLGYIGLPTACILATQGYPSVLKDGDWIIHESTVPPFATLNRLASTFIKSDLKLRKD